MSTTIPTKDVGETRVVFRRECEIVETDEDRIEEYIKFNMRLEDSRGRY